MLFLNYTCTEKKNSDPLSDMCHVTSDEAFFSHHAFSSWCFVCNKLHDHWWQGCNAILWVTFWMSQQLIKTWKMILMIWCLSVKVIWIFIFYMGYVDDIEALLTWVNARDAESNTSTESTLPRLAKTLNLTIKQCSINRVASAWWKCDCQGTCKLWWS